LNPDIQPIRSKKALDSALGKPRAILFKHSTRCWVSSRSLAEVKKFLAESAEVPVYLIDVIADRVLSREVAERLDVWHQSPQAILVEDGRVVWHASHSQVTEQALAEAVSSEADDTAEAASTGADDAAEAASTGADDAAEAASTGADDAAEAATDGT
jgi:bacillithiol system protein YtxJ